MSKKATNLNDCLRETGIQPHVFKTFMKGFVKSEGKKLKKCQKNTYEFHIHKINVVQGELLLLDLAS